MALKSMDLKQLLERQHYELVGRHSAVKICEWTKQSMRNEGFCYKQKFYGINSHRCVQMTPALNYCSNSCVFCWRPLEYNYGIKIKKEDSPKKIVDKCIEAQIWKLAGFGGTHKSDKKKLAESKKPMHFAISLSGEPTIYSKLKELIKEIHKRGMTSFVVTNGMFPNKLKGLNPTQLYISINAPNEKLYKKICAPVFRDCWKRLLKSLKVMKGLKTRKTLRITLIKNLNMIEPENYAKLIKIAAPDFVEVKSYMWVGASQKRLNIKNMPLHPEVKDFAKKIGKACGYKIVDEKKESRVVLLMKKDLKTRKIKF
jgi:tRNA wybutosine-synthesizing protein 1